MGLCPPPSFALTSRSARPSAKRKHARQSSSATSPRRAPRRTGYTIAMVHDSGRSESGKTMDRATLHAIMDRVRSGLTDGVIVALTDRLGRAPIEEAMAWVRELNRIGGVLVPADAGGRPVDLADPQAETNLVLQLQMARQFWLTKAAGFKRSRRDAVAAGKFVGPTPLGYERVTGRLRPDPARAGIVTAAYRAAAQDGRNAAQRIPRGQRARPPLGREPCPPAAGVAGLPRREPDPASSSTRRRMSRSSMWRHGRGPRASRGDAAPTVTIRSAIMSTAARAGGG